MGAHMFMDSPIIARKYSNNDLLIEATINPKNTFKNLKTFKETDGKYLAPVLIYRGEKTKLLSFNDFIFRNLQSFRRFIPMINNGTQIIYSNNFEDSLGMIDLFHKNKEIVYHDQALI
jgi:hypothetical protein